MSKLPPKQMTPRGLKIGQNLRSMPAALKPIGFDETFERRLAVMPPFVDDSYRERAWCVATFDADSGALIRAGIYSSPARGLTQNLRTETMLEGPSGVGTTYQQARDAVVAQLKSQPNYRWLWRAVRDCEARAGMGR